MKSDDLERWADGGAPGDLGELLRAARQAEPSAEQIASLGERLGPLFDAPPGAPVGVPDAAAAHTGAAAAGPGLKLIGGLIVAALVGGGIWLAQSREAAPGSQTANADGASQGAEQKSEVAAVKAAPARPEAVDPPPLKPEPSGEEPGSALSADEAGSARTPAVAAGVKPASKPSEASLLRQAQAALRSDPARALALTRQHQALYPRGALAQEREVIAIEALSKLGKDKQAKDRAGEFGSRYPKSAHQKKVETTVAE